MALDLPAPIEAYFAAANTDDSDRVAACFTDEAVVHDEGHDIVGREEIRTWAVESRRKYRFHAQPLTVDAAGDRTVVSAHLTGDFPGNPVDLSYRFKLAHGKIAAVEIGDGHG
jgi:ketosteroid isomerase-like protein